MPEKKLQDCLTTSLSFPESEYKSNLPIMEKLKKEFWIAVSDYTFEGITTVIFKRSINAM